MQSSSQLPRSDPSGYQASLHPRQEPGIVSDLAMPEEGAFSSTSGLKIGTGSVSAVYRFSNLYQVCTWLRGIFRETGEVCKLLI